MDTRESEVSHVVAEKARARQVQVGVVPAELFIHGVVALSSRTATTEAALVLA